MLWDANTGVTLSVIKHHKKGVSHIAFSANGSLLISIGMDDNRTIAVHNTRTSALVGAGKAGRGTYVTAQYYFFAVIWCTVMKTRNVSI